MKFSRRFQYSILIERNNSAKIYTQTVGDRKKVAQRLPALNLVSRALWVWRGGDGHA